MYCNTQFQKNSLRFQVSEAETSEKPKSVTSLVKISPSNALLKTTYRE